MCYFRYFFIPLAFNKSCFRFLPEGSFKKAHPFAHSAPREGRAIATGGFDAAPRAPRAGPGASALLTKARRQERLADTHRCYQRSILK